TIRRESQSGRHRNPFVVFLRMACLTKQLQVIKTQGNLRVVDVIRRQINLVVHDLTAGAAPLTQTVTGRDVSLPRLLPRLGFVKLARPRLHMITPLGARRAPRRRWRRGPRGLGLSMCAPCPIKVKPAARGDGHMLVGYSLPTKL